MKLRQIFKMLNSRQKRNFVFLFIIMLIGTFVELIGVGLIMPLVNVVSNPEIINDDLYQIIGGIFNLNTVSEYVIFIALLLILVYIVKNVYLIIEYDLQYRFVYNTQKSVMVELLNCYLNEEYQFHVQHNPAELQRNIFDDIQTAFQTLLALIQFLTEILVCVALTLYMLYTDFFSTGLIIVILLVFLTCFTLFYKKYSYRLGVKVREASADQIKWVQQSLSGIREVKVSDSEIYFSKMFSKASGQYAESRRKQSIIGLVSRPIMETFMICGLLGIIIVKAKMGIELIDFIPTLSLFVVSAFRMLPSFNRISQAINNIMYGKSSIDAVVEELEKTGRCKDIKSFSETICEDNNNGFNDITIKNVSFTYNEELNSVFDNISLIIKDKESIAIVGESGAGKSTLADLMLGILYPQSGDIIYNNHSIYSDLKEWHSVIGYIPQTIYLLDDTIMRNVAFGIPDDKIEEERVWAALREAQLDEYIEGLPEGLRTKVGDRGIRLSGGQRQRVGIARALYNNPQILIMDEATSALDNDTEEAVMHAVDGMKGKRTLIIIAHRLTTIKNCNRIYRLDNGELNYVNYSDLLIKK